MTEKKAGRESRVRRVLRNGYLILLARLIVGGVFVYASHDKILYPEEFAVSVKNYDMSPYNLLAPFAIILPWLEFWVGIMLILGFWTRAAAVLTTGMLIMFIMALGQAVARGLDIECGCFTAEGDSQAGWRRIWEDLGLLILCLLPLIWGAPKVSLDRVLRKFSRDSESLSDQTAA